MLKIFGIVLMVPILRHCALLPPEAVRQSTYHYYVLPTTFYWYLQLPLPLLPPVPHIVSHAICSFHFTPCCKHYLSCQSCCIWKMLH